MDRIENLLKEKGIKKSTLAEKLGITRQSVNSLLKNPTRAKLEEIAAALGVPVWQLFISPDEVLQDIGKNDGSYKCPHCGQPITVNTTIS